MRVAYHALEPEKRSDARTSRNRRHQMQAGRGIKYEIPGRQLDFVGTVAVFDY